MITDVFAPLSIPSPPLEWQVLNVPIGEWLHGIIPAIPAEYALSIRAYAVAILIGIIAAVGLTGHRLTQRGVEKGLVLDISLFTVPLGIIGARVFHVLTHPADYFGEGRELIRVLFIWEGGIAIFGALIGGAIGIYIACRITGLRFWTFADALAPGLLLAQAFGRLGNYFNHELFGWPTDLPWGLEIENTNLAFPAGLAEGTLFHPTFLYEIVWNLIGVAVLLYVERKWSVGRRVIAGLNVLALIPGRLTWQWGRLIGLYLVWYGAGRIVWETIRVDPSEIIFGLRTNVWAAVIAVAIGLAIIVIQSRRHYGTPPSPYLPGRAPAAVVDSEETYSDSPELGNDAADSSEAPALSGAAVSKSATSGAASSGTGKS